MPYVSEASFAVLLLFPVSLCRGRGDFPPDVEAALSEAFHPLSKQFDQSLRMKTSNLNVHGPVTAIVKIPPVTWPCIVKECQIM